MSEAGKYATSRRSSTARTWRSVMRSWRKTPSNTQSRPSRCPLPDGSMVPGPSPTIPRSAHDRRSDRRGGGWILSEGTNLGPLNGGVPPTGKRFRARHSHWFRVADGKLVEHWATREDLPTMLQHGILRPPGGPPS